MYQSAHEEESVYKFTHRFMSCLMSSEGKNKEN